MKKSLKGKTKKRKKKKIIFYVKCGWQIVYTMTCYYLRINFFFLFLRNYICSPSMTLPVATIAKKKSQLRYTYKEELKTRDAPIVTLFRNYFTYYDQKRKSIEGSTDEEVTEVPTEGSSICVRVQVETEDPIGEEVKHFTDLVRYLFCPKDMEQHWKGKMAPRWGLVGGGCQVSSKKKQKKERWFSLLCHKAWGGRTEIQST
jgi:hypothetical protein